MKKEEVFKTREKYAVFEFFNWSVWLGGGCDGSRSKNYSLRNYFHLSILITFLFHSKFNGYLNQANKSRIKHKSTINDIKMCFYSLDLN
jgi:hypothetical protein